MPYYLAPYVGSGTRNDPFRPVGSDQPGWSAIDLRADNGVTVDGGGWGFALLYLPPGTSAPARAIKLAEDPKETIALTTRQVLTSRLPLDFSKDRIIEDLFSTLLLKPPDGWWNALRPANGFHEAWLGGQRILYQPVVAGGTLTDNFNRADEIPLQAPWLQSPALSNTMNLESNTLRSPSHSDKLYYYASPTGWTADQSSEFTYVVDEPNGGWAPVVRIGSNGEYSLYGFFQDKPPASRAVDKVVNGTWTTLVTVSGTVAAGGRYKIAVTGSTIRFYDNGVERAESPVTDTSLTTAGRGAGFFNHHQDIRLDDWIGTGEVSGLAGPLVGCRLLGVKGLVS
jgi:hypothetical protein